MIKISVKELEAISKAQYGVPLSRIDEMDYLDVYHIHNWDHIIKHWDEDLLRNENVAIREFYYDMKDMLVFLRGYLKYLVFDKAIIVASQYGGQFVGIPYTRDFEPCIKEITQWLHNNNMRINSASGLQVSKDELMVCIDMISEGGFMGMSGMLILIPELKTIIRTHHHMNYIIYTRDEEKQSFIIKKIIKEKFGEESPVVLYM